MSRKSEARTASAANAQRASMFWFLGLLAVYLVGGVILLEVPLVRDGFVEPWTRLNATSSAALATLMGIDSKATGTLIESGSASLEVKEGCNGIHALLVLLASVFAFPAPWSRRVIGALAGAVTVLGFNLVRLVNLIIVARYFPSRLELFHIYIWQTLIILLSLSIFLVWGNYFAEKSTDPRAVHSS